MIWLVPNKLAIEFLEFGNLSIELDLLVSSCLSVIPTICEYAALLLKQPSPKVRLNPTRLEKKKQPVSVSGEVRAMIFFYPWPDQAWKNLT